MQPAHLSIESFQRLQVGGEQPLSVEKLYPFEELRCSDDGHSDPSPISNPCAPALPAKTCIRKELALFPALRMETCSASGNPATPRSDSVAERNLKTCRIPRSASSDVEPRVPLARSAIQ